MSNKILTNRQFEVQNLRRYFGGLMGYLEEEGIILIHPKFYVCS